MSQGGATGPAASDHRPVVVVAGVRPEPDPAVLAAIVAALEQCWPRPAAPARGGERPQAASWRFSGRFWARPAVMRRDRPWSAG